MLQAAWKDKCTGMTIIELCIVMAIASVLLAMVLGLSRHVDHIVKMRRTQAELGTWHEALEQWHRRFEHYPYASIEDGVTTPLLDGIDWNLKDAHSLNQNPLATLTNRCRVVLPYKDSTTNLTFYSYMTHHPSTIDPWGTPYVYIPDSQGNSYVLYSCGPDRRSQYHHQLIGPSESAPRPNTNNGTLDDVYMVR